MDELSFVVESMPQQAGSSKKIPLTHRDGSPILDDRGFQKAIIKDANPALPGYKAAVRHAFEAARPGGEIWTGPVGLTAAFIFPRPKSHYRTGKHASELRPDAPFWKSSKPDGDKLLRALMDALTFLAYRDDAQVAWTLACKCYGAHPLVRVRLALLDGGSGGIDRMPETAEIGRLLF